MNPAERAINAIEAAFKHRSPPGVLSDSRQLSDVEYAEVMQYAGLDWRDVTLEMVEEAPDAVFWFSPEAFCYYLPGVLIAGIEAECCDLAYFDVLFTCLDRSPVPEYWDDFFAPRFTLLTHGELEALEAWIDWMEAAGYEVYQEHTYPRVRETLALLKERATRTAPTE